MHDHRPRFECRFEPAGTWMVWDNDALAAATLAGYLLHGLENHRAQAACAVLASIYGSRLDAPSVSKTRTAPRRRKTPCFGHRQPHISEREEEMPEVSGTPEDHCHAFRL